jgi:penicillin-binding protein 2
VLIEKAQSGDDLYMTIDIRLQKLAESLLGEESGAIVALDPRTGEVLAMASRPGFNPNILSRELTGKQWEEIVQDERHPLTNRATQGQYPPGSTFKIVMAAAALETDTVQPATQVRCVGGYPFGKRVFRDWKAGGHGMIDLKHAIIHSCDVYFYTVGNRMGIDTIAAYAGQFGLGKETGIELPSERTGNMPSTTWKERVRHEPWYPGETISAAIGQGYVTVTPLQMARLVGIVANNGVSYKPHLVRTIMRRETGHMDDSIPDLQGHLTVDRRTLELIQEGLAGVVTEGTATKAKSLLITIAGKTGTAQAAALRTGPQEDIPKKFRDHAWFVSYAPVESPRIAVAVLVEHMGHGGSTAAPLAKQLIEEFVKLRPLDPMVADPERSDSQSVESLPRRGAS